MSIGQLMKNMRDKGWIPRGYNEIIHAVYDKRHKMIGLYKEGKEYLHLVYKKSLRELVSKESGLWQFVCENGMINANDTPEENAINLWRYNKKDSTEWWYRRNYQYRVIESSLKDESELESFILENIKIEG